MHRLISQSLPGKCHHYASGPPVHHLIGRSKCLSISRFCHYYLLHDRCTDSCTCWSADLSWIFFRPSHQYTSTQIFRLVQEPVNTNCILGILEMTGAPVLGAVNASVSLNLTVYYRKIAISFCKGQNNKLSVFGAKCKIIHAIKHKISLEIYVKYT